MNLNEEINKFNLGDDSAFENIIKIMNKDINSLVYKYHIPGQDKEDMRSIAMQEIFDCMRVRKLKRGKGFKKVLNSNDSEIKNKNFIKAAINYRFIREIRDSKANIRVSYDIPFLQDNGEHYKDRKGKPLYIGAIFRNDKAYLIENMKNTKLILNIPSKYIHKNEATYDFKNPLDNSISFDLTIDDNDNEHGIKDVLEFNNSYKDFLKTQNILEKNIMLENIFNMPIENTHKAVLKQLIEKSKKDDIKELKTIINKNREKVRRIKKYLLEVLA